MIGQIKAFGYGDFKEWLRSFESIATANEWADDEKKLKMIAVFSEVEALEMFYAPKNEEKFSYTSMYQKLESSFSKTPTVAQFKLDAIEKLVNESFSGFAA